MRIALLLLTLIVAAAQAAPVLDFVEKPYGLIGWGEFDSAPYPHESRANGRQGRNGVISAEFYQDSTVALIVPTDFEVRDTIDLIVHFHGHGNNALMCNDQFRLGQQLAESGVNAVLVIPQGPYEVSDSQFGKIDQPGGFTALVEEALASLQLSGITTHRNLGRIIIMGHSGGYYTLGQIIKNGDLADHIVECWCWDATYGQLAQFAEFAKNPDVRYRSIFTNHLAEDNVDLLCLMQDDGTRVMMIHEDLVTDRLLAQQRVMLMHTELTHNQVIAETENFKRWLRASVLAD